MATIPETYRDLFTKKAFAHLATVGANNAPQVTPVWCDWDGTYVRINTARGRVKEKNLRKNPKVALSISEKSRTTSQSRLAIPSRWSLALAEPTAGFCPYRM